MYYGLITIKLTSSSIDEIIELNNRIKEYCVELESKVDENNKHYFFSIIPNNYISLIQYLMTNLIMYIKDITIYDENDNCIIILRHDIIT